MVDGLRIDPLGSLSTSLDPQAGIKGPTFKERKERPGEG